MGDRARAAGRLLVAVMLMAACTRSAGTPTPTTPTGTPPSGESPSQDGSGAGIRDIGPLLGLREDTFSYGVQPHDYDGDGWTDVLVIHHSGPKQLLHNDEGTGLSLGAQFVDRRHGRPDSHDCAWADVDQDGDADAYCTKGARRGTVRKWNELWIQGPAGVFEDRAAAYGVEDAWGRGRRPTFIDLDHDAYPDLFVGNESHRRDGRPTPNRTFVNEGGERYREVDLGLTLEIGAHCAEATDLDGDGWDDLVLCADDRLALFLRRGDRFVPGNATLGAPDDKAKWATVVDVSADGRTDLIVVLTGSVHVLLRQADGTFADEGWSEELLAGTALAVGDLDGAGGPDLFVVQGCIDDINVPDVVFLNGGDGARWEGRTLASGLEGCGDVAASFDFDGDGRDEFYVLNGRPLQGSDQLITMGDWEPTA